MAKVKTDRLPKDQFFDAMERIRLTVTYNDVRLQTGYSEVMPDDVDIQSYFSRNVPLKLPVVSAAMDTVTEHAMAIGMAKLGGLGIIHRNLTPEQQAEQVARVKYHLNGMIKKPVLVKANDTIEEVLRRRDERGYTFHSFPVIDEQERLVGILTQNNFDFCLDKTLRAEQIMTPNPIAVHDQDGNTVQSAYEWMIKEQKKALPVTDDQKKVVGLYVFSDVSRIVTGGSSKFNLDDNGQLRVGAAIGTGDDAIRRVELLLQKHVDVVVIDTAHGDSKPVYDTLREIKRQFDIDVVVGNISQGRSAKRLLDAGADGIKVGQGPGSICTTRPVSGIGCPQVTAIYRAEKATRGANVPICADGGLEYSGDIPIAIGAGASSVMMGKMLAGTDESPGEVIFRDGKKWFTYRGMGSIGAMEEHAASRARYRVTEGKPLVAEGVEALVEAKGPLALVMAQYEGGLQKGMGYVGASSIRELQTSADFDRISPAGQAESHTRVQITREPLNYRRQ